MAVKLRDVGRQASAAEGEEEMATYYQAGNGDEHRHRTISGAEKCALKWLREVEGDLREEAEANCEPWARYRRNFLQLEPVGVIAEIHTR